MHTPLCDRILVMCADIRPLLPAGPLTSAMDKVAERLGEGVLRVAVGGRLNAGKSTLVNALLGQRLAPTGATECTTVAAWFRPSHANKVTVHLVDGTARDLPARPGGGIPEPLGVPREQVDHLTVYSVNRDIGAEFIVIDTPGRDALSALDDYSMAAIRQADALIFVMPQPGADEEKALTEFRSSIAGTRLSGVNVIGVLSRIDTLAEGTEPPAEIRAIAARLAARGAQRLHGLVAEVIPVAGLVAMTARGGDFTETDAQDLAKLAGLDESTLADLLFSYDDFLELAPAMLPVDIEARRRLFGLLGLYGIRMAIEAIQAGTVHSGDLLAELTRLSGIPALLAAIRDRFMDQADALRADAALALLEEALNHTPAGGDASVAQVVERLREGVRTLRRDPSLRRVELAGLVQMLAEGGIELPEEAERDLRDLLEGRTTARRLGLPDGAQSDAVKAEAARRVNRWKTLEYELPRRARRHATVVRELLEDLYFSVT